MGLKSDLGKSVNDLILGNEDKVSSIWKWVNNTWAVYLPQQDDFGADFAESKGFVLLQEIEPGEGFWVNCNEAKTLE